MLSPESWACLYNESSTSYGLGPIYALRQWLVACGCMTVRRLLWYAMSATRSTLVDMEVATMHKTDISPQLLRELDAAKYLSMCPRTLWSLRASGEIVFLRVGHVTLLTQPNNGPVKAIGNLIFVGEGYRQGSHKHPAGCGSFSSRSIRTTFRFSNFMGLLVALPLSNWS